MATETLARLHAEALRLAQSGAAEPVLPGSVWRSRGTAGHQDFPVRVVRLTSAGRVVFVADKPGRKPNAERRHTVDEAVFRRQYALEQQAPRERVVEALAATAVAIIAGRGEIDRDALEREIREADVVESLTPDRAAATAPPSEGNPDLDADADAEQLTHSEPEEEGALGLRAAVEPIPETEGEEGELDPLQAFVDHGLATIGRLEQRLARTAEDRELARLELEELDKRLVVLREQRQRVGAAIEAALRVASGAFVPPGQALGAAPLPGATHRKARAGERLGQRQWVLDRFTEQPRWAVRDLAPHFARSFGLSREGAVKNISSILTERIKHKAHLRPRFVRLAPGLYEAVGGE